jgi:hypothetical protein
MPISPLIPVAAIASLLLSAIVANAKNFDVAEQKESLFFARAFLKEACDGKRETDFVATWDRHEKKHWSFYANLFYRGESRQQDRAAWLEAIKGERSTVCKRVRAIISSAPSSLRRSQNAIFELLKVRPKYPLYLAVAARPVERINAAYKGKKVFALNAQSPYLEPEKNLLLAISHELLHGAFAEMHGDREALPLKPPLRSLFWEGAAIFALSVLYPEEGNGVLELPPEDLAAAPKMERKSAKELWTLIESGHWSANLEDRFYSSKPREDGLPKKIGYYLGLQVFRRISARSGNAAALSTDPAAFQEQAMSYLKELSK